MAYRDRFVIQFCGVVCHHHTLYSGQYLKNGLSDLIQIWYVDVTGPGGVLYNFIALIHPIQWTIAYPVGADRPAKRQKKTSCVATSWPVRSTVHSPDGASYFLPV